MPPRPEPIRKPIRNLPADVIGVGQCEAFHEVGRPRAIRSEDLPGLRWRCIRASPYSAFITHLNSVKRYTGLVVGNEIQVVSNENGEPTAVIVPIELWREIESERETAYLLKSERMKARLLAARERRDGIPFEAALEKLGI